MRIRTETSDDLASASSTTVTSSTGQTSSTGSNSTTATTATSVVGGSGTLVLADGQSREVLVEDAGSALLRRNGSSLTIVSTESNPGWAVEVEVATGREVEGDFRNGALRVKFNFELEDGVVKIMIDSEASIGTSGTTSTTDDNRSTSTTDDTGPTSTTGTTAGSAGLPVGSVTYNLDSAGTVTVIFANGGMTIGSINPAAGWTVDKADQSSNEIEVELKFGESEVELHHRRTACGTDHQKLINRTTPKEGPRRCRGPSCNGAGLARIGFNARPFLEPPWCAGP